MDLIGHLAVIEEAGLVTGDELWSEGAVTAMFPNLAHCHQWAYESLWDAHRRTDARRERVIQSHMICDWVIHYGPDWTPVKQKIGWAYREMPRAVERVDAFMDELVRRAWVDVDPRELDTREHLERDFGHTVVECALDLGLAERYSSGPRLDSICREFGRFADEDYARDFVAGTFSSTGGFTTEPARVVEGTLADYARWSKLVKHPHEFAALTLLRKFDAHETPESLEFVLEFLASIWRYVDPSGTQRMVSEIVERIADPELAITPHGAPAADAGIREDRD